MITTAGLIKLTGYPVTECSNFRAGREEFVRDDHIGKLTRVSKMSQTEIIERHILIHQQITPAEAMTLYHIYRLSERVREINRKLEKRGAYHRIFNVGERGPGKPGIYKFEFGNETDCMTTNTKEKR